MLFTTDPKSSHTPTTDPKSAHAPTTDHLPILPLQTHTHAHTHKLQFVFLSILCLCRFLLHLLVDRNYYSAQMNI